MESYGKCLNRRQRGGREASILFIAVGPSTLPTLSASPQDVVLQKIQEISSTFAFGHPHLYTRGTSRLRCIARPRRSPGKYTTLNCNPNDGTDLAVVAGVNDGGGSRITPLDGGNEDRQFHVSGASTWAPGRENGTKSECVFHYNC